MRFKPSKLSYYGDSDRRDAYYAREAMTTYRSASGYGAVDPSVVSSLVSAGGSLLSSITQGGIFCGKKCKEEKAAAAAAEQYAAQAYQANVDLEIEKARTQQQLIKSGITLAAVVLVGGIVAATALAVYRSA